MEKDSVFYICPVCFQTCDTEIECHRHQMVECVPGKAGTYRRQPVHDSSGRLVSRAPRWYMEAVGWVKAGPPVTPLR